MPAKAISNGDGTWRVETPNGVHAKKTSKAKADAQVRLLNAVDHGFIPNGNKEYMKRKGA